MKDVAKLAFRQICATVGSLYASEASDLSDSGISQLSVDPSVYTDAECFRKDYLICSFLSKYRGLETGVDLKQTALSSFAAAELECKSSNLRLSSTLFSPIHDPIFHRASRLIARALGPFRLGDMFKECDWGPGATPEFTRTRAYLDTKHAELPFTVTSNALPYFKIVIQCDPVWSEAVLGIVPSGPYSLLSCNFNVVEECKVVTVPKNAKTDRTIGIEPRGNMFLQKGVGRLIRKSLKRVGVDLDDQSRNQFLASIAQEQGLSTIDLKMASDTVCREVVWKLLPFEWASYLDDVRCHKYVLPDSSIGEFEKFSSMGNGFTFELESLIFWSLVRATVDDESTSEDTPPNCCAVYGDDIICPQQSANELISVLALTGFTTNTSKTFIEGRFFESCGRHYYDGVDVTPIYQKEIVIDKNQLTQIRFYNRLTRYAVRFNDGDKICEVVNSAIRVFSKWWLHGRYPAIPYGTEGDDGYLVNHEDSVVRKYDRNRGFRWLVVLAKRPSLPANDLAMYAYALRQGRSVGSDPKGWIELENRNDASVSLIYKDRWLEPTWEFALSK